MRLRVCGYAAATILILATNNVWAASGQAVFEQNCAVCHKMLSPKFGDKAAWAPRIKQGTDALVASVIKGKGGMPARAGKPDLSDDDIKAAVEYVTSKSQ
jgi:cytochrome c5